MKFHSIALLGAAFALSTALAHETHETPALKDSKDKVSYSIGVTVGNNIKQQNLELNAELVAAGVRDVLAGKDMALSEQEIMESLMAFQMQMQQKMSELAEKNQREGAAFLAENKDKPGVKTLPSGLQYKVIKEGDGKTPTPDDTVKVHYRGTFIDGEEFDSSDEGEPVSLDVSGVIPGWTQALQQMQVGSKWQLFIPSELAYGPRGPGPIGPNKTLIFDIELLEIE